MRFQGKKGNSKGKLQMRHTQGGRTAEGWWSKFKSPPPYFYRDLSALLIYPVYYSRTIYYLLDRANLFCFFFLSLLRIYLKEIVCRPIFRIICKKIQRSIYIIEDRHSFRAESQMGHGIIEGWGRIVLL